MPTLDGKVEQQWLRAYPGVSTSDHKPVGSVFHVAPTPQVNPCPPSAALVVRVSGLRLSNIIAGDVDGSSDAYCLFLTNPPNLFGPKTTPSTTIKCGRRRADRPAHIRPTPDPHLTPRATPPQVPLRCRRV